MKAMFKLPSYLLGKVRDSIPNHQEEETNKLLVVKKRRWKIWLISSIVTLLLGQSNDQICLTFNKRSKNNITSFEVKKDSVIDVDFVRKIENDTTLHVNFKKES